MNTRIALIEKKITRLRRELAETIDELNEAKHDYKHNPLQEPPVPLDKNIMKADMIPGVHNKELLE